MNRVDRIIGIRCSCHNSSASSVKGGVSPGLCFVCQRALGQLTLCDFRHHGWAYAPTIRQHGCFRFRSGLYAAHPTNQMYNLEAGSCQWQKVWRDPKMCPAYGYRALIASFPNPPIGDPGSQVQCFTQTTVSSMEGCYILHLLKFERGIAVFNLTSYIHLQCSPQECTAKV